MTNVPAYNIREETKAKESILDPQDLRDLYLFGVKLTDNNGVAMSDAMLQHYIDAAQEWLQTEVAGLVFKETEIIDEKHDYYVDDYQQFGFIKLFKFPVKSISNWSIQFPLSSDVLTFDPSWLNVDSITGMVSLLPESGTLSQIIIGAGGSFLPPMYSGLNFVPGIISLDYKAGFDADNIPELARSVVGRKAAIGVLDIAGDLIIGAGIAAKNISLDGASQSIQSTSSATNSGYGARIINYNKELKLDLPKFRKYYEGIGLSVA